MNELDTIILNRDIKEYGLKKGDLGAIVQVYKSNKEFEVEFVTTDGKTIALITLQSADIRKTSGKIIPHARAVETSVFSV